jgi:hypothetical protein
MEPAPKDASGFLFDAATWLASQPDQLYCPKPVDISYEYTEKSVLVIINIL